MQTLKGSRCAGDAFQSTGVAIPRKPLNGAPSVQKIKRKEERKKIRNETPLLSGADPKTVPPLSIETFPLLRFTDNVGRTKRKTSDAVPNAYPALPADTTLRVSTRLKPTQRLRLDIPRTDRHDKVLMNVEHNHLAACNETRMTAPYDTLTGKCVLFLPPVLP